MINQRTKDFAVLAEENLPNIWTTCYPKRIIPPPGYANPRLYSASLTSCALLWEKPKMVMLPHTVCALNALKQAQMMVPTYFIRNEFAQAVANTKLPMDFKLSELRWPLNAMLFVLPDNFVKSFFKLNVPFLSVCRVDKETYPTSNDYRWAAKHGWEISKFVPIFNEVDRMCLHFPCYTGDDLPCDCSGSWPLKLDLSTILSADFVDATIYERSLVPYALPEIIGAPTLEEEKELNSKVTLFAIKLMLAFTARPHIIKNGSIARKAQLRHGKPWRDALYNPSTVGWDYIIQRASNGPGTGTHASPKLNWRPGHFTHQFVGKRNDPNFVPATALPRKEIEGTIDWEKVSTEVQTAFWRNHELRWLEPVLVGINE